MQLKRQYVGELEDREGSAIPCKIIHDMDQQTVLISSLANTELPDGNQIKEGTELAHIDTKNPDVIVTDPDLPLLENLSSKGSKDLDFYIDDCIRDELRLEQGVKATIFECAMNGHSPEDIKDEIWELAAKTLDGVFLEQRTQTDPAELKTAISPSIGEWIHETMQDYEAGLAAPSFQYCGETFQFTGPTYENVEIGDQNFKVCHDIYNSNVTIEDASGNIATIDLQDTNYGQNLERVSNDITAAQKEMHIPDKELEAVTNMVASYINTQEAWEHSQKAYADHAVEAFADVQKEKEMAEAEISI